MIMMTDPQFLLLDEPFGGVHPELKTQLEDYLVALHRSGKTIILISHEMPSVFRICERLVVLDHGNWSPRVRPKWFGPTSGSSAPIWEAIMKLEARDLHAAYQKDLFILNGLSLSVPRAKSSSSSAPMDPANRPC